MSGLRAAVLSKVLIRILFLPNVEARPAFRPGEKEERSLREYHRRRNRTKGSATRMAADPVK